MQLSCDLARFCLCASFRSLLDMMAVLKLVVWCLLSVPNQQRTGLEVAALPSLLDHSLYLMGS